MDRTPTIALDARLALIAEMIGRAHCTADIGCDHGRLCASLLQRGWIKNAILTDISKPSLDKARALIRHCGLEDSVRFCVCDGIPPEARDADVAVIAGMGGRTIAGILSRAPEDTLPARLILEPNVRAALLRDALNENGWRIRDERIAKDGRRCYVVMEAVRGAQALTFEERVVGPVLLRERPALLADLRDFHVRVGRSALAGALQSGRPEEIEPIRKELDVWERLTL